MNGFIMIAMALLLGVDKILSGDAVTWLRTVAAILLLLVGIVEVVTWIMGKGWQQWGRGTPPPAARR